MRRETVPDTVCSTVPFFLLYVGTAAVGATDAAAAHAVGAALQLRNVARACWLRVPAAASLALGTCH